MGCKTLANGKNLWYPLGHGQAEPLNNFVITSLAQKYGKNAGQIILRSEVQNGFHRSPKILKYETYQEQYLHL